MVVLAFPANRVSRSRLTASDLIDLRRRWPNGEVVELVTGIGPRFDCFVAKGHDDEPMFVFWREVEGPYVRQNARTAQKVKGVKLAHVMPLAPAS